MWQVSNLVSVFYGSPYVMMDKRVIRQALKLVGLKKGDIFYDLGCGNGDVLLEATKLGAKCIGIEISPYYYIYAKIKIAVYNALVNYKSSSAYNLKIEIYFKNIDNVNYSKANVVYCYLLPRFLEKLALKFRRELKPGSRLISIGFPVNNLAAAARKCEKIRGHKVYLYKF